MTRVLLVTGARSLADDPAAERWARGLIREELDGVGLLIVGDAPGPDAWALTEAVRHHVVGGPFFVRRYATKGRDAGWVQSEALMRVRPWTHDIPPRKSDPAEMTRAWFLLRNVAMVENAQRFHVVARHDVRALALLDGRKDGIRGRVTRGTEHTAGLAERAGLAVTRETWRGEGT